MLKLLAKVAEKYAKSTNTACFVFGLWHQPKMPASLIKKDYIKKTRYFYFYLVFTFLIKYFKLLSKKIIIFCSK